MSDPHERLDAALDARRLDLDMSWKELALAARTSEATLRAYRSGARRPTGRSQRRLEDTLKWAHGSIDAILDGGEATPADAPQPPAEAAPRSLAEAVERAEARLEQINVEVADALRELRELRGEQRDIG